MKFFSRTNLVVTAFFLVVGCGDTVPPAADTQSDGATSDTQTDTSLSPDVPDTPAAGCGDNQVTLTFSVDDSANKTYKAWTPQKAVSEFSDNMLQIKQFNSDHAPYFGVDYQPP